MQTYEHLSVETLLDLLADQTALYTRTIIEGATRDELNLLRETVISLQKELAFRKETYDDPDFSLDAEKRIDANTRQ